LEVFDLARIYEDTIPGIAGFGVLGNFVPGFRIIGSR
jgi:hypothetical protein